jgi:error-prone DNA polymerase
MIEWLGTTAFSFCEGVSSPDDLVNEAVAHGYEGLAVADRMGVYGTAMAWGAAQKHAGFFYAPGIRLHFDVADPIFMYPLHKAAHARLCTFLSNWALEGMNHGEKGLTPIRWADFKTFLRGIAHEHSIARDFILISVPSRFYPWPLTRDPKTDPHRVSTQDARSATPSFAIPPTAPGFCPLWLLELREICGAGRESALSLAYPLTSSPGTQELTAWLEEQSQTLSIPLVASSLPLSATKNDQDLCDLVAAIRHLTPIKNLGYLRQANGERRLLTKGDLKFWRHVFAKKSWPLGDPIERTHELAKRHHFSLAELRYRYPQERLPPGESAPDYLRRLAYEGAQRRYPQGAPLLVQKQIEHELKLISELKYEDYFLTIYDILSFAREQKILHQGRGSAANSVICYCLGITAIDPVNMNLLFERFLSVERHEPPDIDVDFEHERREEVMQEVYRRYGRHHAAMVATTVCFRGRMAFRMTAKALGYNDTEITELQRLKSADALGDRPKQEPRLKMLLELYPRLKGLPRHMGLHTGGFILSSEKLSEQTVLTPARMKDRSVIPFNKDDVEILGWMKVDLLSLGMLTAIRKCFAMIGEQNKTSAPLTMASVPHDCPQVYYALGRADTVGTFQVESRAQMNMLPRLVPKNFYDIVVEVALVRPGPLQGGMVHPYLKRRQGKEPIVYDHPDLEPILKKTMGVPIFQEQVMKMAVAIAGFSPGESDQMRKIMSGTWRMKSHMSQLKDKLFIGMASHGLSPEFIARVYKQIQGFGEYGFPESHAASFAIITYISVWLKVHHPAEFLCALLNSQPMGFYAPRSLIGDAERHGVRVLPVDLLFSEWDSILDPKPFVRLGFSRIKGFSKKEAEQIVALKAKGYFSPEHEELPSLTDLRSMGLESRTLEKLIRSGALREIPSTPSAQSAQSGAQSNAQPGSANDPRRKQLWDLSRTRKRSPLSPELPGITQEPNPYDVFLQKLTLWEQMLQNYSTTGVQLRGQAELSHPAEYVRKILLDPKQKQFTAAEALYEKPKDAQVKIVGLISVRQKPPTAGGFVFVTLEDETGFMNLTLMPDIYIKYRLTLNGVSIVACEGVIEKSWQADPSDPFTAALSVRVTHLWNPFLNTAVKEEPAVPRRDYR